MSESPTDKTSSSTSDSDLAEPEDSSRWTIEIVGRYLSIEDLLWEDVPTFAVLTGPNGVGKSHLLAAIQECAEGISEEKKRVEESKLLEKEIKEYRARAESNKATIQRLESELQDHPKKGLLKQRIADQRDQLAHAEHAIRGLGARLNRQKQGPYLKISGVMLSLGEAPPYTADILSPDDIVLVTDAFQSIQAKGNRATGMIEEAAKLLEATSRSPSSNRKGEKAVTLDALVDWLKEHPGLAINVDDPLLGLAFIFQSYRHARLRYIERNKVGWDEAVAALPPPPWEILDTLLASAEFPYTVVPPDESELDKPYSLRFVGPNGSLAPEALSSGEKTLVGIVCSLYAGQHGGSLPKLLLLDEPDAHLHPFLAAKVLDSIRDEIVNGLGVRVIMTTHSASTVALSPKESVFVMSRENEHVVVRRPTEKWEAVSLLTAGIVTVGPETKQVFVEDQNDVDFYQAVVDLLESEKTMDFPAGRLSFHRANKDMDGKGSGGCTKVVEWVRDMDAPYIHGLIDHDRGPDSPNGDPPRVHRIGRYSIENYLLDPIILAVFLSRVNRKAPIDITGFDKYVGLEANIATATSTELQVIADAITSKIYKAWDTEQKPDANEKVRVEYMYGQTIELPVWLIREPGKTFKKPVQDAFGVSFHVQSAMGELRYAKNIPKELVATLRAIAES